MTAAAAGRAALAPAPASTSLPRRLRDWRRRYLLAEVLGTLAALATGTAGYAATGSLTTAAVAASVGETAGFYLGIVIRTAPDVLGRHRSVSSARGRRRGLLTLRATVAEASDYAVAEAMDTFLVRPGLIYVASSWTGAGLVVGLLVGKLCADVAFYSVVIPTYELRRRLTGVAP